MTQEDKNLLLKDLSARVPYRVKIEGYELPCIILNSYWLHFMYTHQEFAIRRPYLRPMSSMTEDEYKEMQMVLGRGEYAVLMNKTRGLELWLESVDTDPTIWFDSLVDVQDWLNAHHFDFRNLIDKGLAIDCTNLNIY